MDSFIRFLLGSLGISAALGLSACGSCKGMESCGTASILYSSTPIVVTYSYISMIMISTIFFYGFIISIILINRISSSYTINEAITHLSSGLLFGIVGIAAGKAMGGIARCGFRKMAQKPGFYMPYLISMASVEVTVVISFLCSLMMIYKK